MEDHQQKRLSHYLINLSEAEYPFLRDLGSPQIGEREDIGEREEGPPPWSKIYKKVGLYKDKRVMRKVLEKLNPTS